MAYILRFFIRIQIILHLMYGWVLSYEKSLVRTQESAALCMEHRALYLNRRQYLYGRWRLAIRARERDGAARGEKI